MNLNTAVDYLLKFFTVTADYGLYILAELKYHNVNFAIDTNAS